MNIAQGTLLSALNGHLNRKGIPKRGDTCIHMTDSLCYTAETNTGLQIIYTPIKINFLKKKAGQCMVHVRKCF